MPEFAQATARVVRLHKCCNNDDASQRRVRKLPPPEEAMKGGGENGDGVTVSRLEVGKDIVDNWAVEIMR